MTKPKQAIVFCLGFIAAISQLDTMVSSRCLLRTVEPVLSDSQDIEEDANATTTVGPTRNVFAQNTDTFVERFADCIQDEKCHVLYHHVQKTGGSFLASSLYPVLNQLPYISKIWCCGNNFMDRFRVDKQHYCDLKFAVYEVYGGQFEEVVSTCQDHYDENNHRALALVTVREPIQRTLSNIHQQCNKGYHKQSPEKQAICKRCSYRQDSAFWDGMVQENNKVYSQLLYNLPVDSFVIDSLMISNFLMLLERSIQQKIPTGKLNQERKDVCDFHMPSDMFKRLIPSQLAYRYLLESE